MASDLTDLIDLVSERVGGVVLAANDEFFAPKENLLKFERPVFLENEFTDRGKWMDGWETRRRRTPGRDWCVIRLGLAGVLRGAVVDTAHFKGNFPESCSLEGCVAAADASVEQLASAAWVELLPQSPLRGDTENRFPLADAGRVTHVRFNIFPDGGVARLRLYGLVVPDWAQITGPDGTLDLAAAASGGLVLAASDMFFGSRHNLIFPGSARTMGEGWETRRRRGPGHDWALVQLGAPGVVRRVEVDTSHFKGNFPESCSLEGCHTPGAGMEQLQGAEVAWKELLPRTPLQADTRHLFEKELRAPGPLTHVRFNIFPDGGVARLRLYGTRAEGK